MSPVLAAVDIAMEFHEGGAVLHVLRGVSLELAPGEIVTLEGPSGSGKTTLLSILGLILTPTAGRLTVAGEPIDRDRPASLPALRKRLIGFVFQQYNLFPSLTAVENVEYALNIRGIRGAQARAEAERMIVAVGLADRARALPQNLSGGQKQRVAIARALAGSASAILADEPTANLDFATGAEVLELLRGQVKREGRAALIVTHDPRVRAVADRGLRLRDGVLVD